MLNNVTIMGRLCGDPELRTTANGNSVASVNIACDEVRNGEKTTLFIKVNAFAKTAENIAKFFRKGDGIIIIGKLVSHAYTKKDGTTANDIQIVANSFEFVGNGEKKAEQPKKEEPKKETNIDFPTDDDLPF